MEKYKDKGLTVVGIGIQDSEANIKKYASDTAMPWPVIYDRGEAIAKIYGISFGAGAVFIDRKGTVAGRFITGFGQADLDRELARIL